MILRNKKESKNIKILNAQKYNNAASVFAYSLDLKEAAGALMNVQINHEIPIYYRTLMHGDANLIHHKLRMLLTG